MHRSYWLVYTLHIVFHLDDRFSVNNQFIHLYCPFYSRRHYHILISSQINYSIKQLYFQQNVTALFNSDIQSSKCLQSSTSVAQVRDHLTSNKILWKQSHHILVWCTNIQNNRWIHRVALSEERALQAMSSLRKLALPNRTRWVLNHPDLLSKHFIIIIIAEHCVNIEHFYLQIKPCV